MSTSIYLDHAAATPMDQNVLAAMQPYFSEKFYNPSATYLAAQAVAKDMQAARAAVAGVLGARPSEIVFTAGGTEANNIAIHGVMARFPEAQLLVSAIEHDSVIEPASRYEHEFIAVNEHGIVDVESLIGQITDTTALVSVMYANNEIGTIQPIREIAQHLDLVKKQRRKEGNALPLLLHTDAAQAANYLDMHVSRLGVDLMTVNGGKLYGPKQSGCLYVRAGVQLEPLIYGGGQEMNIRSGTENVAAVVGFGEALQRAQQLRHDEVSRLQVLQKFFITELAAKLPAAVINGSKTRRLPNNVHITMPGIDNERVLIQLDEAGIMAAAGSACSASSDEPSHVLAALGLDDSNAQSSLRFTMGRHTTKADIETTVHTLVALLS